MVILLGAEDPPGAAVQHTGEGQGPRLQGDGAQPGDEQEDVIVPPGVGAMGEVDLPGGSLPPAQPQQGAEVGGGAVLIPAPQPAQQQPERPAGDGVGGGGHNRRVDGQSSLPGDGPIGQLPGLAGEDGLVRPEEGGGVRHPGQKAGGDLLQHGQHLVADAVAGVVVVLVGAVLHVGQGVAAQVVLHLGAGGGEQGADDLLPFGEDAPQPPQAGAPGQVEQDGLHVVAGGVGGGDEVGPRLPGGLAEESIAHIPGGFLDARAPQAGLTGHVAGA